MTTQWFGERVERREDQRLLTGAGRFLDDAGHDALAAAFVRSPHAHARITGIDVADALDVDGLVAVYTWDDLPGRLADPLPLLIPHPDLTEPRTQFALANGEVNHVGEAVAMVVAADRYVAEDAADRIVVDYEPLPPVVGIDAARAADRLVHPDVPGNVAAVTTQELGDARARSPPRPGCWSSTCRSSGRCRRRSRAAACTPAGTPTTGGSASAPRPRRRPVCGPRWPTSSSCPTWPSRW